MNFVKTHWYGILISILFIAYLCVFFTGVFAPKKFEECTKLLAEDFIFCQEGIWCSFKAMMSNMWCEIKTFYHL